MGKVLLTYLSAADALGRQNLLSSDEVGETRIDQLKES